MQLYRLPYYVALFAAALVLTTGCSKNDTTDTTTTTGSSSSIDSTFTTGIAEGSTETAVDADDLVENSTFSNTVTIDFGTSVTVTNPLDGNGVTVATSGSDVTITATTSKVEYVISGTTTDGSVKIYSDNKYKVTLNGASITNSDGPALNLQSKKRAFIVLAAGTTSTLVDGASYATSTEDQKGTLFAEGQVIFSGTGTLNLTGKYKHAICSDQYVRIREGNITVTSAVGDGIHTNDAFIADGGTVKITSSDDGIQCEEGYIVVNDGTFVINTAGKGIGATYDDGDTSITPYVTINGGNITITTTEGEGIESKSVLTINNGYVSTNTVDDGINGGTAIYINGGHIYSISSGNDAMDSNGTFTITGGIVVAAGSGSPEAGIDVDARTLKITGGLVVGIGGATSGPTASVSTVNSLVMGSGSANKIVHIEAADGTEVMTFLAPKAFSTLLFAGSKLKSGTSYTVYTGGSVTDGSSFNGLYLSGSYSGGTSGTTFTTSGTVTQIGGSISRG
jgi:hypothetical protein